MSMAGKVFFMPLTESEVRALYIAGEDAVVSLRFIKAATEPVPSLE